MQPPLLPAAVMKQNEGIKSLKKLRSSRILFPEDVAKVATSQWLASLEVQV
jgi:hypothetical protein